MSGALDGQVALVTGAGKGIGRACALALAAEGAHVIAVARTPADLDRLAADAPADSIEPWSEDVRADALYSRIRALPRLDVLVNNAGTNKLQPVLDVDDDTLDMLIALNIRAAFKVAQAAASVMARQGSGSIVNISSQMGHVGGPRRTVYAMTKHAIEGMTKSMALDLAPHKVRVNAVAPTVVETPMTAPFFLDPAYREAAMASIPLKEVLQPEDVAAAVVYLASPGARLVTGTSLRVDGGATAI
ncbi:MAG: 3-oxoacyl-ACP reductase [Rhizobiales bacterium 17-65-6]|nr:MAG: 3-oxoacyl-ACP reductase [Rhizobiales bacterium 17-65-6]